MAKKETNKTVIKSAEEASTLVTLDALRKQLKDIETISGTSFKCDGSIKTGLGADVDIPKTKDIESLLKLGTTVALQEEAYNQYATKSVGLESFPAFTFSGKKPANIHHDIKLQIQILGQEDKRKELLDLIKEGEAFISEAEKKQAWEKKLQAKGLKQLS